VPLPWWRGGSKVVVSRAGAGWALELTALVFHQGPVFLGRTSPFLEPEEHLAYERPTPRLVRVATVEPGVDEAWCLTPQGDARVAIDGVWATEHTPVRHGCVLDLSVGYGPPASVHLLLGEEPSPPPPDDAVLACARNEGAFTVRTTEDQRLDARLSGGDHSLRLDSASWLERILFSPLQFRLRRLELEVWHPDALVDRSAFLERHRALIAVAPFTVELIEAPGTRTSTRPRPERVPFALFPADGWAQVPLVPDDDRWLLRHRGETLAFIEMEDGLREVTPSGVPSERAVSYFRPVLRRRDRWPRTLSGFLLIPGPSDFLTGRRTLGTRPLTRDAVAVFADELLEAQDAAGPLLARVCGTSDPAALAALWQPYVRSSPAGLTASLDGDHVCGFFEEATVPYWLRFERDLPVLAQHPMLQRLRVLRILDGAPAGAGDPRQATITEALRRAAAHRPVPFEIWLGDNEVL
jgi:hypothetical protein